MFKRIRIRNEVGLSPNYIGIHFSSFVHLNDVVGLLTNGSQSQSQKNVLSDLKKLGGGRGGGFTRGVRLGSITAEP
jgi:hypothetical protein